LKRIIFIALTFALLLGLSGRAHAQSCSASASAISFGSVSPISQSAVSATGTVSVTCTRPVITFTPTVQVCLDLGGTSPRDLVNGVNQMQYDLYQNAGHSLAWGSIYYGTTPISLTLSKPGLGTTASTSVTTYG
jgi:spore coat protein U-like protein